MAEDKEDREGGFHNQNPNPNHNNNISKKGSQGKSCKGCLYYSSLQRSKSKNPTCVGIPRTLHQGQSLYNPFFIFRFVDSYDDACGSVWSPRKLRKFERKFWVFFFVLCLLTQVWFLMGFLHFWVRRVDVILIWLLLFGYFTEN